MLRSVFAVLAGLVVMVIAVATVQLLGHHLFPPPPGIDPRDHDAMIALIATMPLMALAMVLVAYALGGLLGALVAAKVSRGHKRAAAMAVGVVLLGLVAMNFLFIPHPGWMVVAGLLIPLPFAWLGRKLAG